jgi:predicted PurR-regulated permease PerM
MAYKKIRKSATMTDVVFALILMIAIITGMFLWLNSNVQSSGNVIDEKYSDAFNELNGTIQSGLSDNINEIKDSIENIQESDNTFAIVWNGFKALGSTLKLPISFLTSAVASINVVFSFADFLPNWVQTLLTMGVIALIVFIVLGILKGDPKL